jgi:16S rRNA (adenine1518-N6/adenine1519-N6)-dimethyltransferase
MRKYGQHFLVNKGVIGKILDAAARHPCPRLVEIGPGKGALTEGLLALNPALKAVEIDPEMTAFLQRRFGGRPAVINENFLSFDLGLLEKEPTLFVSNLPYIDAAAILDKVLAWPHTAAAVFMFQKEQAQRITAAPGGEFYGPLSVLSQARAEISSVITVSPGSFAPPPKVKSEVLLFKKRLLAPEREKDSFPALVKGAFAYKRKSLVNSLHLSLNVPENVLMAALAEAGVPAGARASSVSVEKFLRLCATLC